MMGCTGLLEELLAEQAAKANCQDVCEARPTSSHGSIGSASSRTAAVAPAAPVRWRQVDLKVDTVETCPGDKSLDGPTSPLSRQIETLAREVDDCLGSLGDQWEEDKRQHRQSLLNELEAQYVAEYGLDIDGDTEEPFCRSGVGMAELDKHALITAMPRLDDYCLSSAEVSLGAADEVLARLREEGEIERHGDEARMSQLRAEVEELRREAEADADALTSPYAAPRSYLHHPGTPHPGLVLDASLSGLDSTLGLQAWREEVDAVLGLEHAQSFEDELRAGAFDGTTPRGLDEMDRQLLEARERVRQMEDAVESAHACTEGELGELDQLLSECEELHEKLMQRGVEEDLHYVDSLLSGA